MGGIFFKSYWWELETFEFDTVLYDVAAYDWCWDKNYNLEGRSKKSGEHHFTWQRYGSQFTIIEQIAECRLALRLKQPPPLEPDAVLATMGFDESWVRVL